MAAVKDGEDPAGERSQARKACTVKEIQQSKEEISTDFNPQTSFSQLMERHAKEIMDWEHFRWKSAVDSFEKLIARSHFDSEVDAAITAYEDEVAGSFNERELLHMERSARSQADAAYVKQMQKHRHTIATEAKMKEKRSAELAQAQAKWDSLPAAAVQALSFVGLQKLSSKITTGKQNAQSQKQTVIPADSVLAHVLKDDAESQKKLNLTIGTKLSS